MIFIFVLILSQYGCAAQNGTPVIAAKNVPKAPAPVFNYKMMPGSQGISSDSTATDRAVPIDDKKKKKKSVN